MNRLKQVGVHVSISYRPPAVLTTPALMGEGKRSMHIIKHSLITNTRKRRH